MSRGSLWALGWLGLVALMAVCAPVLASSHPLLMKSADGAWSSPWLRHLKPMDVVLPGVAVLGLLLRRRPGVWLVSVAALGVICFAAVRPPQTTVYDRYRTGLAQGEIVFALHTPIPYSPSDRLRDQKSMSLQPPDTRHWLGTTVNAEDLLSRMIHASRVALSIGFIATGIAVVIGIAVGGLMGYFSRSVDLIGMRVIEVFEAIPQLYLLLTFVAFFPRNAFTLYFIMVIIGLTSWTGYARFVRAEYLKLREQDFVQAARACGLPLRSVLFRHMLPNALAPVLVSASFGVAGAILSEATLSFLGLGLVDEPSWGQMLNQAVGATGGFVWWMAVFPGLAIFLTVFAYNVLGETLRDVIDPHTRAGT